MAGKGHNSEQAEAHAKLERFLEAAKDLNSQIKDLQHDLREYYKDMKASGFDTTALRTIVKLSEETPAQREARHERESIIELYKHSLDIE